VLNGLNTGKVKSEVKNISEFEKIVMVIFLIMMSFIILMIVTGADCCKARGQNYTYENETALIKLWCDQINYGDNWAFGHVANLSRICS